MRSWALAVLLAVAGCGGTETPNGFPHVSSMYGIDGASVSCPDASYRADAPTEILCGWQCVYVDGTRFRSMYLTFTRADATAPWAHTFTSYEETRLDECPSFASY